jgi:hypothetical protein
MVGAFAICDLQFADFLLVISTHPHTLAPGSQKRINPLGKQFDGLPQQGQVAC